MFRQHRFFAVRRNVLLSEVPNPRHHYAVTAKIDTGLIGPCLIQHIPDCILHLKYFVK